MDYVASPETLVKMTGRTLEERVKMWKRYFPGVKRTVYHLRNVYKPKGVKKRKIVKAKIISPEQEIRIRDQAIETRERLDQLKAEGYSICYLDECCTTKSTMPTHEWTPRNHSF